MLLEDHKVVIIMFYERTSSGLQYLFRGAMVGFHPGRSMRLGQGEQEGIELSFIFNNGLNQLLIDQLDV